MTERIRRPANRKTFSESNLRKLPVKGKQYLVWDAGTGAVRGLAVLVSPKGAKSYRSTFYFKGNPKAHTRHLGRVGVMTLEEARTLCRNDQRLAKEKGIDPRADDPALTDNFKVAIEDYIKLEQIGRRGNKSAEGTKGVMLNNTVALQTRPIGTIRYDEIDSLLASIRDGDKDHRARPYLANRLHGHLHDCFGWCARRRTITASPMTDMPLPWEGAQSRDRFYSDDEIRCIWIAADHLDPLEGAYVKLNLLLALRLNELALARWSEFDNPANPTLFVVPTERVKLKASSKLKSKPVYRIPLPPLANRILRSLKRSSDLVFPGLKPYDLKATLAPYGAPDDYKSHTARHTIATFLENAGHDKFDRALILNHTKSDVTQGYSHGFALDRKRDLLIKWADHVEGLLAGEGVARLR